MKLVYSYLVLCFLIPISYFIDLYLLYPNASLRTTTLYPVISNFLFYSLTPSIVGFVGYLWLKRKMTAANASKLKDRLNTFFTLALSTAIAHSILLFMYAALGHLDCGSNCVPEVGSVDRAVMLYGSFWMVLLFLLRKKAIKTTS